MVTCPYCLSPIGEKDDTVACQACGARHHRECWEENRGCCASSCPEKRAALEIEVPPGDEGRLVLTREAIESAKPHRPEALRQARGSRNPCMRCGKDVPRGELYCVECTPAREESQHVRNLGPMLVMLGVLAVMLAWFVTAWTSSRPAETPKPPSHRMTETTP